MDSIKFPVQQTAAERHQPSMPTLSREAPAVLAQIADKARQERRALDALKTQQTPTEWLDLTSPVKSVSTIVGHYDNIQGVHEDEVAKLQTLAMGAEVIGTLVSRGRTLEQIRAIPPRALAAEIGEGGARAVRLALRNPDVRALIERGAEAEYTWERGETYASAEHLRDPMDTIGLTVQDGVEAVRSEIAKEGLGREIARGYLDSVDVVRASVETYGGRASKALMEADGAMVKTAGFLVAVGTEMVSTPLRIISPNVAASRQGMAVIDTLMLATGPAGQVGKKHSITEIAKASRALAARAVKGAGQRIAQIDVKKLFVVNPRASARARLLSEAVTEPALRVTPRSPTIPNARVTPRSPTIPNARVTPRSPTIPNAPRPPAAPARPSQASIPTQRVRITRASAAKAKAEARAASAVTERVVPAKASAPTEPARAAKASRARAPKPAEVKRRPRTQTRELVDPNRGSVTIGEPPAVREPLPPNLFEDALRLPGPWAPLEPGARPLSGVLRVMRRA